MTVVALHYEVSGPEGAPAVLLGGSLGTDLAMWDRQVPLADRLRLVRFDSRGHGCSPAPPGPYSIGELGADVLALMDAIGLERVSYCGLSIGGMVGMWLGVHAPERIDRLVLLCTAARVPAPERYAERARAVLTAGSTEQIADGVLDRWLTPEFAAEHPAERARLRATLVATSAEGYAGCCAAIATMDLRAEIGAISAPTLVISGAQDLATPVALQAEIAAAIPDARHAVVDPAAHLAAVEQPVRINELIGEHLT